MNFFYGCLNICELIKDLFFHPIKTISTLLTRLFGKIMSLQKVCGYLAKVVVPESTCVKYKYPFHFNDTVFVFGEIYHMPDHCVFVTKDGKTYFGYHTDNFIKLTDDEI